MSIVAGAIAGAAAGAIAAAPAAAQTDPAFDRFEHALPAGWTMLATGSEQGIAEVKRIPPRARKEAMGRLVVHEGHADLLQVVDALLAPRRFARRLNRRQ